MTKREREQAHMDRLRAARGLPPQAESPRFMDRTRAAVCYLNTTPDGGDGPSAMAAFLAIFHPEIDPAGPLHLDLMQSARRNVGRL